MIVEFDRSFERSLNKVNNLQVLKRLKRVILQIETSSSLSALPNTRKISGFDNYYRIRIGDFRIGIELVDKTKIRFIIIAHRKDIYKLFP